MIEVYIENGITYNVSPEKKEEFLRDHKDAKLKTAEKTNDLQPKGADVNQGNVAAPTNMGLDSTTGSSDLAELNAEDFNIDEDSFITKFNNRYGDEYKIEPIAFGLDKVKITDKNTGEVHEQFTNDMNDAFGLDAFSPSQRYKEFIEFMDRPKDPIKNQLYTITGDGDLTLNLNKRIWEEGKGRSYEEPTTASSQETLEIAEIAQNSYAEIFKNPSKYLSNFAEHRNKGFGVIDNSSVLEEYSPEIAQKAWELTNDKLKSRDLRIDQQQFQTFANHGNKLFENAKHNANTARIKETKSIEIGANRDSKSDDLQNSMLNNIFNNKDNQDKTTWNLNKRINDDEKQIAKLLSQLSDPKLTAVEIRGKKELIAKLQGQVAVDRKGLKDNNASRVYDMGENPLATVVGADATAVASNNRTFSELEVYENLFDNETVYRQNLIGDQVEKMITLNLDAKNSAGVEAVLYANGIINERDYKGTIQLSANQIENLGLFDFDFERETNLERQKLTPQQRQEFAGKQNIHVTGLVAFDEMLSEEDINWMRQHRDAMQDNQSVIEYIVDKIYMQEPLDTKEGWWGTSLVGSMINKAVEETMFVFPGDRTRDEVIRTLGGGELIDSAYKSGLPSMIQLANTVNEGDIEKGIVKPVALTEKEKRIIEVSGWEEFGSTVGSMGPMIGELIGMGVAMEYSFGAAVPALGARALMQLYRTGNAFNKLKAVFFTGLKEEAKFLALQSVETNAGVGFGFGAGQTILSPYGVKNIPIIGKYMRWMPKIIDKSFRAGISGATSSEVAETLGMKIDEVQGLLDFQTEFDRHYGDLDENARRYAMNVALFSFLGLQHASLRGKKGTGTPFGIDLMTTGQKSRAITSVNKAKKDLLNGREVDQLNEKEKAQYEAYDLVTAEYGMQYMQETVDQNIKRFDEKGDVTKEFKVDFQRQVDALDKIIGAKVEGYKGTKFEFVDGRIEGERLVDEDGNRAKAQFVNGIIKIDPYHSAFLTKQGDRKEDTSIEEVFAHEVVHMGLDAAFKGKPNMRNRFNRSMANIFKDIAFDPDGEISKDISSTLAKFIKENYGKKNEETGKWEINKDIKNEEYLAFLGELLANPDFYYNVAAPNVLKEIKQEVLSFTEMLGLKPYAENMNSRQLVELLARFGNDIRQRRSIGTKADIIANIGSLEILDIDQVKSYKSKLYPEGRKPKQFQALENEQVNQKLNRIWENYKKDWNNNRTKEKFAGEMIFDPTVIKEVDRRTKNMLNRAGNTAMDPKIISEEALYSERGLYGILKNYDPAKGIEVSAMLNAKVPGSKFNFLDTRILEVIESQPNYKRINIGDKKLGELSNVEKILEELPENQIVLKDALEIKSDIVKDLKIDIIKDIKSGKSNVDNLTFRDTESNLTKDQINSIFGKTRAEKAETFNKKAPSLKQALYDQQDASGVSLGMPDFLLNAFFTKQTGATGRARGANNESGAGLPMWKIKPKISNKEFIDVFNFDIKPGEKGYTNSIARVNKFINEVFGKNLDMQLKREVVQSDKGIKDLLSKDAGEVKAARTRLEDAKLKSDIDVREKDLNQKIDRFIDELDAKLKKGKSSGMFGKGDFKNVISKKFKDLLVSDKIDLKNTEKIISSLFKAGNFSKSEKARLSQAVNELQREGLLFDAVEYKDILEKYEAADFKATAEALGLNENQLKEIIKVSGDNWKKSMPVYEKLIKKELNLDVKLDYKKFKELGEAAQFERKRQADLKILEVFPPLAQMPKTMLSKLMSELGFGSYKVGGHRLNKGGEGDISALVKYLGEEVLTVGKGKYAKWMEDVFWPSTWGGDTPPPAKGRIPFKEFYSEKNKNAATGFKGKINRFNEENNPEYTGKPDPTYEYRLEEFAKELLTPKHLQGNTPAGLQRGYEKTIKANKKLMEMNLRSMYEQIRKAKGAEELKIAVENVQRQMQLQTNIAGGISKGATPMVSVSKTVTPSSTYSDKTHNEHDLELRNSMDRFLKNFIINKNSPRQARRFIKLQADLMTQSLIPQELYLLKDSKGMGGPTGRVSEVNYLNTLLRKGDAQNQVFLGGKLGQNFNDYIFTKQSDKFLRDILAEIPKKDWSAKAVELNQRLEHAENYKNVRLENEKLAKQGGLWSSKDLTNSNVRNLFKAKDAALEKARRRNKKSKGISVLDFDDTVAKTKSKIIVRAPYYGPGKMTELKMELTPAEFAKRHGELENAGAAFDFSEFNKVVGGKKGPLFDKLQKAVDKFGNENVFILTARPQTSAKAIHAFLKGLGVELKIENITGLENGTPIAKANWIAEKAAQGYNDFYFADDAVSNVKAVRDVLEAIDVKSKTQIAYNGMDFSKELNKMIERKTGINRDKIFSKVRSNLAAKKRGEDWYIPSSADDFSGLMYKLYGKGKQGDKDMGLIKENFLNPYGRAEYNLSIAKMQLLNDFKGLKKQLKNIPKNLRKEFVDGITYEQAIRIRNWHMQGIDIPGLSKRDIVDISEAVNKNSELKSFSDQLVMINKGHGYPKPTRNWELGSIATDLTNGINGPIRAEYLKQFTDNVDAMFTTENLYKLEAAYGTKYVEALKNILGRMKRGSNRPDTGRLEGKVLDYINNSVGVVMFLNSRSALLQTISAINYINWSDNNVFAAGKTLLDYKQYGSDFMTLMNSDWALARRNGLKLNVSESEIADAAAKNGYESLLKFLLEKGFLPTKYADSFATAAGGATMYRNRINTYKKSGFKKPGEAEKMAMRDWIELSEANQQSSRADRISMQQASNLGRIVLAFANTPMQYARLQKKAYLDLVNGRGDAKTHVSKIIYYGIVQNFIFNALQQALFRLGFQDDVEDEDKKQEYYDVANGMVDSFLRGSGVGGAGLAMVKNVVNKIRKENKKKNPAYENAAWETLTISPPIHSKISKLRGAGRDISWNMDDIKEKGWSLENTHAISASSKIISATLNLPADRVIRKIQNMKDAVDADTETWQRFWLASGWDKWQLDPPKSIYKNAKKQGGRRPGETHAQYLDRLYKVLN